MDNLKTQEIRVNGTNLVYAYSETEEMRERFDKTFSAALNVFRKTILLTSLMERSKTTKDVENKLSIDVEELKIKRLRALETFAKNLLSLNSLAKQFNHSFIEGFVGPKDYFKLLLMTREALWNACKIELIEWDQYSHLAK